MAQLAALPTAKHVYTLVGRCQFMISLNYLMSVTVLLPGDSRVGHRHFDSCDVATQRSIVHCVPTTAYSQIHVPLFWTLDTGDHMRYILSEG